jgi:hypothetical protein
MRRSNYEALLVKPLYSLPIVMLQRATDALDAMIQDWSEILDYIEALLGDKETMLHPDEHDKLLEDDKSGTRSRKYFWVINSLTTFRSMIDESYQVYIRFKRDVVEPLKQPTLDKHPEIIKEAKNISDRFAGLGTRAYVIRGRAIVLLNSVRITSLSLLIVDTDTLGSQLFKATSVAESHKSTNLAHNIALLTQATLDENRKSTKLGQNVMLLTYVSIFYLPLGFCTVSKLSMNLWRTTVLDVL